MSDPINVIALQEAFRATEATLADGPPPSGARTYELSWSRSQAHMRLRSFTAGGLQEWLFKAAAGQIQVLDANAEYGNLIVHCQVDIAEGGAAQFYLDSKDDIIPFEPGEGCVIIPPGAQPGTDIGQGVRLHKLPTIETQLPVSQWRLCYFREQREWRLRNEPTGDLWLVSNYSGVVNLNWMDGGSHIFHQGWAILTPDGVAHFRH